MRSLRALPGPGSNRASTGIEPICFHVRFSLGPNSGVELSDGRFPGRKGGCSGRVHYRPIEELAHGKARTMLWLLCGSRALGQVHGQKCVDVR